LNKAKLKAYAPQARKDFIAAVTARAHRLGLAEHNGQLTIAPAEKSGDLVIIAGQSWPAKISRQRDHLVALIEKDGFSQTMEAVAYTWFNRFAALRFMEIHDYLSHGYRVLSSRAGGLPEILNAAPELAQNRELPDLNHQQVVELKLAGDQDGELYRLTLIAQCNALSSVMPFLFERIDNETELLLPDNLLLTDSVIAKLVTAIPEEDWQQVEIIGWLYQFYISEKKDQVIGKVVKSEDIPAATQLFTPNWIVQYLVQNSIGRLWLMANPASTLKTQWPYYIEPAEQTPEVQAQLDALIQTRMAEDAGSLNPETITVLDPACGSGHILVEAYEVLKAIYLERGYQPRNIPRLILEKNLFGIDIDDRAAQLAGFALLMKARADDRRLFDNSLILNVLALQESKGLDADEIVQSLNTVRAEPVEAPQIRQLISTFAHAKTFGSLIQITPELNAQLPALDASLQLAVETGDLIVQEAALNMLPLVRQAQILGLQFDAVVVNPPYLSSKNFDPLLKKLVNTNYPEAKSDLFSCFIVRATSMCRDVGGIAMVTMQNWMFLSSFQQMREWMLREFTITSLTQIGYNSFPAMNSKVAQAAAFCITGCYVDGYEGTYINLNGAAQSADKEAVFLERDSSICYKVSSVAFGALPGTPIAFGLSESVRNAYQLFPQLVTFASPRQGIKTGDNEKFLRRWYEVSLSKLSIRTNHETAKWFPCSKGGEFRKWYGNHDFVLNWMNSGDELRNFYDGAGRLRSRPQNIEHFFKPGITWTTISSSSLSMRLFEAGFAFESSGSVCFPNDHKDLHWLLCAVNSGVIDYLLKATSPSLAFSEGAIATLPIAEVRGAAKNHFDLIKLSKEDWDSYERSWNYRHHPILTALSKSNVSLEITYNEWIANNSVIVGEMKKLEEENNRLFIEAYRLANELTPSISLDQITLTINPAYRYRGGVTDDEHWSHFRTDSMEELVSYAIGCMMGRYRLDKPGLIYAHAGNVDFDKIYYDMDTPPFAKRGTFLPDSDGIVPITDELWFEDDAANRIQEFLRAVWNAETLDENTAWLAESLGQKGNETPIETIRRYIAGSFFKDHLQTYKKRPIYWLFSSGKQGAFQALVYLHRYHEGTLARMRAEYVVPLTGKIQSRIEMLEKDAAAADSNASRNKLNKDIEKLKKKHVELLAYDEKLRHYADQRIQLDLDDGVKVNYGKFGDLLAEVKAVSGGTADD